MESAEVAVPLLQRGPRNVHGQFHADAGSRGATGIRAAMHQIIVEQNRGPGRGRQGLQRAIEIGLGEVGLVETVVAVDAPERILPPVGTGDIGKPGSALLR